MQHQYYQKRQAHLESNSAPNDCISSRINPTTSTTTDTTSDDKDIRVWRCGTYQGIDLEDEDGEKEGVLEREVLVSLDPSRLKGRNGEEESQN